MSYQLPTLFKKDKNGRIRFWECRIYGNIFETRAGLLHLYQNPKWKARERGSQYTPDHGSYKTAEEVAYSHAHSIWEQKKRHDNMVENPDELDRQEYIAPISPVLATRFDKLQERHEKGAIRIQNTGKLPKTMYIHPDRPFYWEHKFDGERVTVSWVDGQVMMYTRGRKAIEHMDKQKYMFHLIYERFSEIFPSMKKWHFDCECILPGGSRNDMRSTISRVNEKHIDNDKCVLMVFDIITNAGTPYYIRRDLLDRMFKKIESDVVFIVQTIGITTLYDVGTLDQWVAKAVADGYEGIMGKDPEFLYPMSNLRLDGNVKYKIRQDEEYTVIDAQEATDAHAGLIMFRVQDMADGMIKFWVTPAWTHENRRSAWQMWQENPDVFRGRMATVSFKYKNQYGVPEEAVLIRIRDEADIS